MQCGDKVYYQNDPKQEDLTVEEVSPYVEMAHLSDSDGWVWIDGLVLVSESPAKPDPLDEQLKFLGF
jgi:hypothetical protein